MHDAFENLLVSSPNGGGLFFINKGQVFRLDDLDTTGIALCDHQFLRGSQPDQLALFHGTEASKNHHSPIPDIHDVLIVGGALYAVGTTHNEVLQLDHQMALMQRWQIPGEQDASHINCLADWNGRIVFSAFGDFTKHREYKGKSANVGFVQELVSGKRLIEGLSQPHSLVPINSHLLLANSETRELREYDANAVLVRSKKLEGYTRGISVQGQVLYVGLSRSRNTHEGAIATATILALDLESWVEIGRIELPAAEIYSVLAIADEALPAVLAAISQGASTHYRQALDAREQHMQVLTGNVERLTMMEASLNAHLEIRGRQYEEHLAALTERDVTLADLLRQQPDAAARGLLKRAKSAEAMNESSQKRIVELQGELHDRMATLAALEDSVKQLGEDFQQASELVVTQQSKLANLEALWVKAVVENQQNLDRLNETLQALQDQRQHAEIQQDALHQGKRHLGELQHAHEQARREHEQASLEQAGQLSNLQVCLEERDARLADVSQRLEISTEFIARLLNSRSWRWLSPLRGLRRRLGF